MCELPSTQYSHCEEPISFLTDSGDAGQVVQSLDVHQAPPSECLSAHVNDSGRRVQNSVLHPVRAVPIASQDVCEFKCASPILSIYRPLFTAICQQLCCVLPQ